MVRIRQSMTFNRLHLHTNTSNIIVGSPILHYLQSHGSIAFTIKAITDDHREKTAAHLNLAHFPMIAPSMYFTVNKVGAPNEHSCALVYLLYNII